MAKTTEKLVAARRTVVASMLASIYRQRVLAVKHVSSQVAWNVNIKYS